MVSDRKLPAPRAGEGRRKGRRERAGGPRLSLSPARLPWQRVSRAPWEVPRAVAQCPLRLAPRAYLGAREHSGAPGNAWGVGHGKRQAGHAKPDRLGVSEEPCQEGGGLGLHCHFLSSSRRPEHPVTRRPILQMGH